MSKYGNRQAVASDGKVFDSKKECARYEELLLLQRLGEISDLMCQVPYQLLPKQMGGKRHERAVSYVADFVYRAKQGNIVVEDTKGFRTKDYILKRKMLLYFHDIAIEEL